MVMEPEVKQETTSSDFLNTEDAGGLTPFSANSNTGQQFQAAVSKVTEFLADLPEYLGEFFGEYKRPIVTVGLVIGAIIAVKLTLAVLDAVNDVPLLEPTFELIGLGYTFWFVYRYLLKASTRKELSEDFKSLKEQVLGQANKNL
ncbi:MAG TPA: CAAD domain-containing protein [Synechococcales cyanobacterium M55_K2018_004]|nr:CAAD domain-containing protein [Synechococcales cyanobacterium M55_K2018_004]